VLGITEGDTVAAEIKLKYDFKGERKSIERIETVRLHHRNASIWDDDRRAAAFVTANDPIVLRFAKNLAGLVRNRENQVIDLHLRTAMAIHQALSLYGISYVVDPNSAYADFVENKHAVDFLQFPRQTLEYKAGDCDDLSILYCALLEAVSVDTAFITTTGHIYIAFALEMSPETARKTFSEPDKLIFKDDKAWIPLEVTEIDGGFLKAWELGVREWLEHSPSGQSEFYPLSEAWKVFKPVGLPGEAEGVSLPAVNQVAVVYERELDRFIYLETGDRVNRLQSQIVKNKTDPRLMNRLGVLYARYGRLSQAEEQFRWAISVREYGPSLLNLGNIYFLRSEYKQALQFYSRAYRVMSGNPAVLLSIAKTYYELEKYEEAEKNYTLLTELSPQLAKNFSYLAKTGSDSVRASEAAKQEALLWEE
jgi:tetratricopeptide (TPR) repeat protein